MFLNKTIINSRKKSDEKNFAGGLMSEKFNYLSLARITKLSLALYRKLISMGMHIILQSLVLVSKIAQFRSYAAGLIHCVAAVWVGIDVAAVVAFQWASRIVAADAALGEEVNSVAIAVEAAGNGEQVGHPLAADHVTAVLVHVGPLQMGKHCCTA